MFFIVAELDPFDVVPELLRLGLMDVILSSRNRKAPYRWGFYR
jgi:hypothetical protein